MARGAASAVGDTRTAKNGYHYTKVGEDHGCNDPSDAGWMLTHHLTAERVLGRHLEVDEMVQFVDKKYKSDPYNPDGIRVIKKRTGSLRKRKATIEAKIADLQGELNQINKELGL